MNIKEVLNSKVLDKNAYEVGTVTDFDIDQKEGTINSMIVSLKKGVFSNTQYHVEETYKLKEYFDNLLGYNLYDLFSEIKENL